jgi:hypothetical protein
MQKSLLHKIGLHPMTALAVVCVDFMLFGPDATGVGWFISIIVAATLTIPCIVVQKFCYKDTWLRAIAKGLFIGVITAIPSPLPAFITGGAGLLGAAGKEMKD